MKIKNVDAPVFDGSYSINFQVKRKSDWEIYLNLKQRFEKEKDIEEMTQGAFFRTLLRKFAETVAVDEHTEHTV